MKLIATNRKAFFDYQILDQIEAGLVLLGPEIKAVRAKKVNITGSYVKPFGAKNGGQELWWIGGHFNLEGQDQQRSKKLLLHDTEIEKLTGKLTAKGYAILPLKLYLQRGLAKLRIGLGVRKKAPDKRREIKQRDINRDLERDLREKTKG